MVAGPRARMGAETARLEAVKLKPPDQARFSIRTRGIRLASSIILIVAFELSVGWLFIIPFLTAGEATPAALAMFAALLGLVVGGGYIYRLAFRPLEVALAALEYFSQRKTGGPGGGDQRLYYPDARDDLGMTLAALNRLLDRQDESLEGQRRFVGSVSHDIRTPLTIMRGDIEVALLRERTITEYQQVLRSNLEEVERIGKLIEDLLTIARSDTGELGLRLRRVSLSNLLHEVRKAYLAQAKAQGITLNLYIEEELVIEGDPDRLRQLLDNLVQNALHYIPREGSEGSGGKVEFLLLSEGPAGSSGKAARIVVRDTGVGIPAKDLPHIFEPFYRGVQPREHDHHGYGLGLAICQFIVQAHGGRIFVESQVGPGSGTAFTILIPSILETRG